MSALEDLRTLAQSKGIDPNAITGDCATVVLAMGGGSLEEVAYSVLRAIGYYEQPLSDPTGIIGTVEKFRQTLKAPSAL